MEKDGQDIPIKQGTRGFKIFQSALSRLHIPFGTGHNTQYGLQDMANMLQVMSVHGAAANSAHQYAPPRINIPHGDWLVQKINSINYNDMVRHAEKMITDTVDVHSMKMDRRNGNTQTRVIAIDKHKIPHYDKEPDMTHLVYSEHDAGTYVFETHMTAKIVSGAKEFHLAMVPVTRDKFNPEFVRKTIQKCDNLNADANICLLDREFYASDVMDTIRDLKKHFIMPAKKDAGIKRAISEYAQAKRDAVSQYTFGNGFEFNLVIVPNPRKPDAKNIFDRYYVFATSLPCTDLEDILRYIPEQYKKRWGIETGYKQAKSIRPYTTSKSASMRMLLFAVALIICNIWINSRVEVAHQTYNITLVAFVMQMVYAYFEYHPSWPPPR